MRLSAKVLWVSSLALIVGGALAAVMAPADEQAGWNSRLSDPELALSVAACDAFGSAASDVSWCTDAAAAASSDDDVGDLADEVAVDVDGSEVTAALPEGDSVLITSIPEGE